MVLLAVLVLGDEAQRECDAPLAVVLAGFAALIFARILPYAMLVGRMLYGVVKAYPPRWRIIYHVATLGHLGVWAIMGLISLASSSTCSDTAPTLFGATALLEALVLLWLAIDIPFIFFLERVWFLRWQESEYDVDDDGDDDECYDDEDWHGDGEPSYSLNDRLSSTDDTISSTTTTTLRTDDNTDGDGGSSLTLSYA